MRLSTTTSGFHSASQKDETNICRALTERMNAVARGSPIREAALASQFLEPCRRKSQTASQEPACQQMLMPWSITASHSPVNTGNQDTLPPGGTLMLSPRLPDQLSLFQVVTTDSIPKTSARSAESENVSRSKPHHTSWPNRQWNWWTSPPLTPVLVPSRWRRRPSDGIATRPIPGVEHRQQLMHCATSPSDLPLVGLYQLNEPILCLRIHLYPGRWGGQRWTLFVSARLAGNSEASI